MTRRILVAWALAAVPTVSLLAQSAPDDLLARPARFTARDTPLVSALATLQRTSGVTIAFSPDLIPDTLHAQCSCDGWTVGAVLRHLLRATDLTFRSTKTQVLIVPRPTPRTVIGRVLGREDRRPLAGTTIRTVDGTRLVVAGPNGRFVLEGLPPGPQPLILRRMGVPPDTVRIPASRDTITFYVATHTTELAPLVVVADPLPDRTRFDHTARASTVTLAPNQIAAIPGVLENDVVRSIQLLPGTVARNDFVTGFNVRGGENDQNLVLLDGMTVFNPTHVGGLFSTFDANTIASLDFLTGGFPARYSGRLSSVLDIRLRDGQRGGIGGRGQVSLLSSKLALDGGLGPATFLVAGRRTYFDRVFAAVSASEAPYWFGDLVAKVSLPLGPSSTLSFSGYTGVDRARFTTNRNEVDRVNATPLEFGFSWGNTLGGITWRQRVGGLTWTTSASHSRFDSEVGFFPDIAEFHNEVRLTTLRSEAVTSIHPDHQLTIGGGFEAYRIRYAFAEPTFELHREDITSAGFFPLFNRQYRPNVWSAFVDDRWRIGSALTVQPGVRVEHVSAARFTGVSPRIAVKYFLDSEQALTLSAGRYFQPVQSVRDRDLPITVYEFWIGADRAVPVARSDQLVLGYERWWGREWQVVLEGYRKTFDRLALPNRAIALRDEGDEFLPMTGESWGLDLLIRRHAGRVRGWFGYSLAKSTRRADGRTFPPSHDRRHTVNLVLETPGPLGATLGLRWTYGSPLPFTSFSGEWDHREYYVGRHQFGFGASEFVSLEINNDRYPAYHRLDLGLRWGGRGSGLQWRPFFQVANVYNRKNTFAYAFDFAVAPPTRTGISQLPIVPTFGLELTW